MTTAGLLLAAGAGRRMGTPKALVHDPDGTSWLRRSVRVLLDGGCGPVHVVLGAGAEDARVLVADLPVEVVVADDWDSGMGASLRAGLLAVADASGGSDTVLVSLVDLPDVGASVVARVLAAGTGPAALARASYDGEPGHPVLLGADHLAPLVATLHGDVGAKPYLAGHDVTLVECGDLATGRDRDTR
ncbi:nucleotidyltransferase family protein [Nocardioides sp. Soil805]|uniref:nucleotidyltransferase family protein n=1 Tax=Nocardioides sp. Soil805 TaxID=1736416 RepID=UPI000702D2FE|nr:nucleotidyltransferase family protein [Nocardioides sp. Soil805]KRF35150.1 molybdopterin-guanine dinucleotide biosynthesis protein MobA [Nocardioides sp. Soil805]